jgi:hypothetical protein
MQGARYKHRYPASTAADLRLLVYATSWESSEKVDCFKVSGVGIYPWETLFIPFWLRLVMTGLSPNQLRLT